MARPQIKNPWLRWLWDTGERVARTFVQGFLTVWVMDGTALVSVPTREEWQARLLGGSIAGVISLLMSFVAKPMGAQDSASFLPENIDPPADNGHTTLALLGCVLAGIAFAVLVVVLVRLFP